MYRLFAAIDLPKTVKDQLSALRGDVPGARWVKPPQMHLTLRFIGDQVAANQFQQIKAALAQVQSPAFDVQLQGVGRFPPSPKKPPRVLWVGTAEQPLLHQLYRQVNAVLAKVGVQPDDHDFNAHITLARMQAYKPSPEVERYLAAHAEFHTDMIPVTAFVLYASVLSPQGPTYKQEAVYPLLKPSG